MRIGRILRKGDNPLPEEKPSSHAFQSFQAEELRRALSESQKPEKSAITRKTISVVSGKGGVGKSNVALNLALSLGRRLGLRTALLDADLGLANADVLMGLNVKFNLGHVFRQEISLQDVMVKVAENVWLIPGGSGIADLADMSAEKRQVFISELAALDEMVDVMLIDTGAGIQASVRDFALASDTVVLVTTPEPPAIKDAYGFVKSLARSGEAMEGVNLHLLVNMAQSGDEARITAGRVCQVAREFLGLDINYLGCLPYDKRVSQSVKDRNPYVVRYPSSQFSRRLEQMATLLVRRDEEQPVGESPNSGFVRRFLSSFLGKESLKKEGRQ